jgi:alkylation response protein AidB-like acyl-CoA dehydrogenase
MDFSAVVLTEAQQAFADEVKAFLDEHLTEEVYAGARERTDHFDRGLYLALGAKGWLMPRWRREDGGAELDDVCVRILENELARRDAPATVGEGLVWPAVEVHGDPELRAELKPKVARGEVHFTLGYSEPDGGSDIAGAKTRAVRDGDEWVINGSKIFTTNAQNSQYTFLITRTDPALPKHKGLTMFLMPLDTPGIEIQALPTVGDERTNIVYYSDVRISDRYRLGEVNNGWSVLHGPLDAEHSIGDTASKLEDLSIGIAHMRFLNWAMQAAARWALDAPDGDGSTMSEDKVFMSGLGRILAHMEAAACTPGPMGRIKGADVSIMGAEQLMDLIGPAATLPYGADGTIAGGAIEHAHRAVQVTATYGGTVEVFRTIIAQHHLGLPRPDYPGRKVFLQPGRPATTAA